MPNFFLRLLDFAGTCSLQALAAVLIFLDETSAFETTGNAHSLTDYKTYSRGFATPDTKPVVNAVFIPLLLAAITAWRSEIQLSRVTLSVRGFNVYLNRFLRSA